MPDSEHDTSIERDLRSLLLATRAITAEVDVDRQLPVIMDAVIDLTGAERAVLVLRNGDGGYQVRAERDLRARKRPHDAAYSRGVLERVFESGDPIFLVDTDDDIDIAARQSVRALRLRAVMCVPLRSTTALEGAIYVDSTLSRGEFSARQREVFAALADHAAIAIEKARLFEMTLTDPLTGLYNAAFFHRRLAEELSRAERDGSPLSLLLIDVDQFKDVNDRQGHRRGNDVLKALAGAMTGSIRDADVAARCGGDEFGIILPGPVENVAPAEAKARATAVAERTRTSAAARSATDGKLPVTVSIGVASYPSDTRGGATELFELADRALLRAKQEGRDRVCTAVSLPER